ncbi:diacylglycerol kinase, catalytic region [Alkaliphilus metalliredigens QYMF]|uniref:Diacylglycerol kinase, catalytic region n=1 Tax=Alkaliphilus metalliredigens (strain QYMF) TaxID=293826 RepID=A6TXD5_ALKMQ|nr:diacylglycerol kinase, catalytic region [Alkaliphilus metalliredigens QYMF]
MTYCFIVNPVSGKNKGKKVMVLVEEVLKKKNVDYQLYVTNKPGEAQFLASQASREKYDVIVAIGGDGTIHEVLNGMIHSKKKLGIIPAGTGNDLAKSLNYPTNVEQALETVLNGHTRKIDIGRINGNYFINFASIGLDALIAEEANKMKKLYSSRYTYVLAVLKGIIVFKSPTIKVLIDGKEQKREIMLLAICNGAYYGGGMKIAPTADVADGYLDVCLIRKMSKLKLLFLFPTIFTGNHVKYKEVEFYRGKKVEVSSQSKFKFNADGEVKDHLPTTVEIIEKGIEIIWNKENTFLES